MREEKHKFRTAALLALVGGYLEIFTYVLHGKRFANAQTGNLIFCIINLYRKDFLEALSYFLPIVSFVFGTVFTELFISRNKEVTILTLLIEIIAFLVIGLFDKYLSNTFVCVILSFIIAMQYSAFKKVKGIQFASTICTGNIRTVATEICHAFAKKDINRFKNAGIVALVILFFVMGAFLELCMISLFYKDSIFVATIFLVILLIFALAEEIYFYKKNKNS